MRIPIITVIGLGCCVGPLLASPTPRTESANGQQRQCRGRRNYDRCIEQNGMLVREGCGGRHFPRTGVAQRDELQYLIIHVEHAQIEQLHLDRLHVDQRCQREGFETQALLPLKGTSTDQVVPCGRDRP